MKGLSRNAQRIKAVFFLPPFLCDFIRLGLVNSSLSLSEQDQKIPFDKAGILQKPEDNEKRREQRFHPDTLSAHHIINNALVDGG